MDMPIRIGSAAFAMFNVISVQTAINANARARAQKLRIDPLLPLALCGAAFYLTATLVLPDRLRQTVSCRGMSPFAWRGTPRRPRGNRRIGAAGCSNGLRARWPLRDWCLRFR